VCQFIIFYFYGEYVRRKNNKIRLEAELKLEEEKSRQYANVVCPCDRQILSTIPLSLNMENRYSCPGCKKDISVFVETKTALTTVPLLNNPLDAPLIAEEVNKLLKSDAN
jgi:transposase-like protein